MRIFPTHEHNVKRMMNQFHSLLSSVNGDAGKVSRNQQCPGRPISNEISFFGPDCAAATLWQTESKFIAKT
jgi:hypothetical protein